MKPTLSAEVARGLLEIRAVKLSPEKPFTWASGLLSPIYCDNRLSLSYPELREKICEGLCALIREKFPEAGGIAGVATAGIPHGMLIADRLKLPFLYVRAKPKEHGLGNQIEGRLEEGTSYVVVEDLVSTGKSSMEAVQALRAAGAKLSGLVSVFSYGFADAKKVFGDAGLPFYSLVEYEAMIREAAEAGYIPAAQQASLEAWRKDPKAWAASRT